MWKKVSGRWISVAAMRRRVMTCWSYFWIAFAPFYIKRFRKVRIFDEKLSVRDVENIIRLMKNPKQKREKKEIENSFIYKDLEEKMIAVMGTKVSVNQKAKGKGKIEIEYYSGEELERIFDLLMSVAKN